jgi:hypothetical protein
MKRTRAASEQDEAEVDDVLLWRWQRGSQLIVVYIRPRGTRSLDAFIESEQRASRLETVHFESALAFARWASNKRVELEADGWSRLSG